MKNIGVIINPNAKKFRTGKATIDNYLKLNSGNITITSPENLKELKETTKIFRKKQMDYICIGGGDGTIHLVLTELINNFYPDEIPPVLILKEGTMNNIARSVKLKGRGPELLNQLLRKIENGETVGIEKRSTIKISDSYCFLFGTGFVTNFLDKAYSGKEKGFMRNLQVAFMCIKDAFKKNENCEIFTLTEQAVFIDGKRILVNPVSGILAGTVEHIGMGFSPLIDAVQPDGKFQVIILGMNPAAIIKSLNKLRKGKRVKSPKYINMIGKKIHIKQEGTFEYTMDGELYKTKNELIISAGPTIKLVKI